MVNPLWERQPELKIRIIISENSERSPTSGLLEAGWPVLSTSCTWFHFVMLFAVWNKGQTVNQYNNIDFNSLFCWQSRELLSSLRQLRTNHQYTQPERRSFISRMRQTLGIFIGGGSISFNNIRIPVLRHRESECRSSWCAGSRCTFEVVRGRTKWG
jgi:hypothetical protein